jgi:hypothetical protein
MNNLQPEYLLNNTITNLWFSVTMETIGTTETIATTETFPLTFCPFSSKMKNKK